MSVSLDTAPRDEPNARLRRFAECVSGAPSYRDHGCWQKTFSRLMSHILRDLTRRR
jgi:hypothetical protein